MPEKVINISCLPIAGLENPYQKLMMEGLASSSNLKVKHGYDGKFFAILKTALFQKPDIIHLDWIQKYYIRREEWIIWLLFPLFIIEVFLVDKLTKVEIVWTLHNIVPHDGNNTGPKKWCRSFFARSCKWIRVFDENSIDRAVVSLGVKKYKFKVVPEGSYVNHYRNTISKESARQQLAFDPEDFVYLYLGAIKPYKGIENLLRSFKNLDDQKTKLIIAGKSFNSKYLNSLDLDHPRIKLFQKFIPDEELEVFFNAANIVVLPFNQVENSGSVILAMGFKKPIIAPAIGVVQKRLNKQIDLLYIDNNQLDEIMGKVREMRDLEKVGQNNFDQLNNYKWSDFSRLFII